MESVNLWQVPLCMETTSYREPSFRARNAIGLHFYPIWEANTLDEWLYNGGPYPARRVSTSSLASSAYMGTRVGTIVSTRECDPGSLLLTPHPWLLRLQSSLSIRLGKVLFLMACLLAFPVPSTSCLVFQAEHNILMHPFHMLGVAGVFGGALFSAMHGSLVT